MLYYQNPFQSKSRRIHSVHIKYSLKVMNLVYHILIGASLFLEYLMIYSCGLNSVLQYSLFGILAPMIQICLVLFLEKTFIVAKYM